MRVLLAADFYPPAPGGLEAHVRRLAHALAARGHDVEVVAGSHTSQPALVRHDDDGGVPVHRVPVAVARLAYRGRAFHPPWPDGAFRHAIGRVLARFDADVVHAHGWCAFSAAAFHAARPVVVTLHDYGLRCPKKTLLRGDGECASGRGSPCLTCPGAEQPLVKRAALATALAPGVPWLRARVARFVAVSGHVAARHPDLRADVIPNFLDPLPPAYRSFAPPTGRGVLFVGPADRHKGLPVLRRALAHLPSVPATVVGVSGASDGPVEFAGRLTGDALWRRYRDAAVVAAPATWPEPCPTVVLEALAMGRPVVGSRTGGLPDLVEHGTTGLLVPPGDERALAAALRELLEDDERRLAMARAAYDSAAQFSTAAVVPRIEAVYASVADRAGVTR